MSRFKRKDSEAPLCACGCGVRVKWNKQDRKWNRFIHNHHRMGEDKYKEEKTKPAPLCACGCKEQTKWCKYRKQWNRFVPGHQSRGKNNPMKRPEVVTKFIGNQHAKGNKHPKKWCRIQSKRLKGNQYAKGHKHTKEFCERQSKRVLSLGENNPVKTPRCRKKAREYMLNGHAAYMLSCIKNPSGPQVELYKLVKQLYPNAKLNYPSLNKSIDIAIPDKMIAIEYDSAWWHDNREKEDAERQSLLENIGWKFLRYKDYVPSIEELKRDLQSVVD